MRRLVGRAACVAVLSLSVFDFPPAHAEITESAGDAIVAVREIDWLEIQLQVTALMSSDERRRFVVSVKRAQKGYRIEAEFQFERYDEYLRFRMTSRRGICEENIQNANKWLEATVTRVAPRIARDFRVQDDVTWRVVGREAGKIIEIGSWKNGKFVWAEE